MFEEILTSAIAAYGQLGLLIVMIIQTLIAPIPSEVLLVFAGAIGLSPLDITIFGGLGLIIGSVIAFFIARKGGRPIVEKLIGKKWTGRINGWVDRNGTKSILFTRLIPLIPFDLISYISGVTSLSFKNYLIATILGAFPRCFVLAVFGIIAKDFLSLVGIGIELTFLFGIIGLVVIAYLDNKGYFVKLEKNLMVKLIKNFYKKKKKT